MTSTVVLRVPHAASRLAPFLRQHNLPGYRPAKAIAALRLERAERRRSAAATATTPAQRAQTRLLEPIVAEIARRGGETQIVGGFGEPALLTVWDRDRANGLVLVGAQGFRFYSKREGAHWARLAYLYGVDDNGPWAVRVPGTVETVALALAWLEPAEVRAARDRGRRVRRQGDVYAVETTTAHDGRGLDELPDQHVWNAETRRLLHRPVDGRRHRPLSVPYPARFVRQRAYLMGRGGRRGDAD